MAKSRRKHRRFLERLGRGRELHVLCENAQIASMVTRRRGMGLASAIARATRNIPTAKIRSMVARAQRAGIESPVWNAMLRQVDGRDLAAKREVESMRRSAFRAFAREAVDPTQTTGEGVLSDLKESSRRIRGQTLQEAVLAELGESGAAAGGGGAPEQKPGTRTNPVGGLRSYVPFKVKPVGSVTKDPFDEIMAAGLPAKLEAIGGISRKSLSSEEEAFNYTGRGRTQTEPIKQDVFDMGTSRVDTDDDGDMTPADKLQAWADKAAGELGEDEIELEDEGVLRQDEDEGEQEGEDGDYAGSDEWTPEEWADHIVQDARLEGVTGDALQHIKDNLTSLIRSAKGGAGEDEVEVRMSEDQEDVFNRDGDEWRPGDGTKYDADGNPLPDDEQEEDETGRVSSVNTYASSEGEAGAPVHRASGLELEDEDEASAVTTQGALMRAGLMRTRQALTVGQRNAMGKPLKRSRYNRPGRIGRTKAQRRKAFSGSPTGAVAVIDKILSKPLLASVRGVRESAIQRAVKRSLRDFERSTRTAS